jgi:hypothetical protein
MIAGEGRGKPPPMRVARLGALRGPQAIWKLYQIGRVKSRSYVVKKMLKVGRFPCMLTHYDKETTLKSGGKTRSDSLRRVLRNRAR